MRSTTSRAARAALATTSAAALALSLAACSAANEPDASGGGAGDPSASGEAPEGGGDLSGDLNGAGASSQQAAVQAWVAGFNSQNPDVTVNYEPSGSGAGREQFLAGAVSFAGSDAYLDDEELTQAESVCTDGAIDIPVYVSPIAVVYNLEGVEDLQLSPATIAGIFNQTITSWDAPEIAADNPDATLPAQAITPVNRSDDSGTTENFTEFLSATAPDVWTEEPDGVFPIAGGEAAQGTSGVISAVQAGAGAIGYADASQAADLGVVAVGVGDDFVLPTEEAAATALDVSTRVEGRPEGDIAIDIDRTTTEAGAYPVILVSYGIACKGYEDAATGELVAAWMSYVVSEDGQAASEEAAGSAPISDELRAEAEDSIALIAGS
ncbi:phosphate ABC transporter substrate-binding protein PstS [Pseudokineococcus lusitanus]|uniref:Phosphate-binding protein n=1 Tax=Pseudokineococcus lusitanus TaxID=763993 RepID=A0A3N1HJW8_9ACTN|nr:phosphate ABC transporter substrate-binding protein PstS [Pseudokineococcus lusitanus]ROP42828.1 phosphate transport system substrate-binding protein [Pseudokineococcus lusitanus]